jgi:hypothetical protein
MSAIATAIVGTAIVGGIVQSSAAGKAADAQQYAADRASETELQMYNQTRDDQAPYREQGYKSLSQLGAGTANGGDFNRDFTLKDFVKDPGYQFRLDQGTRQLQGSAAARGGLLNGGTLKALDRYNQDYSSGEYSNAYSRFNNDRTTRFNRLASLAGVGQTSLQQTGQIGQQTANNISNNQLESGNARASGYIGTGNAISGGIQTLGNYYLQRQYAQPAAQPAVASGGAGPMYSV